MGGFAARRTSVRWLGSMVAAIAALSASAPQAVAQATLAGFVRDSTGVPVADAQVAVIALNRLTRTDEKGAFLLTDLTPGMRAVSIRRVGFSPFTKLTSIVAGDNEFPAVTLRRLIVKLDTVVTEEQLALRENPLLREMAENMKIGLGKFVLRPELEKLTALRVDRVFQQIPAFRIVTDGSGHSWIARGGRRSLSQQCSNLEDRAGAISPPDGNCLCFPLVYLDAQPLSIGRNEVPNINRYAPETLEAIEMYSSAAQAPIRYSGLNSQCGVIILHTRRGPLKKGK